MRFSSGSAAVFLLWTPLVSAQTYTTCNPLTSSCSPDPAFGRSATYDFTQGASKDWTASGSPSYSSKGAVFTVAKQGDSPLITSNFYIMFGHVEYVIQAAPGTGIVSSAVLQSDDLDEIDWEFLGGNDNQVQTNYFGKGNTVTYDRSITYSAPNNHDAFHTYAVDWTADHVTWQIDGVTVRTLTPQTADTNQYPQTPMRVKVGAWAGGDSSNPQGTIQWAGGVTNYAAGPFSMYTKSISVTDYSTGSQYKYSDQSGTWQSIQAVGGKVNGNSGADPPAASSAADPPASSVAAPSVISSTSASNNAPMPFSGTHRDPSSSSVPSVYPWVSGSASTLSGSVPSGWPTTNSGASGLPKATSSSFSSSSFPTSASEAGKGDTPVAITSTNGPSTLATTTKSASPITSATIAPANGAASSSFKAATALSVLCAFVGSAFPFFLN
ncbi:Concanavalin A-like lectin/glucanase domain containing protein [Elaphomyces granulatus]